LVFDQQELRREVGLYSDLYAMDLESGHVHALTREARLQDPDLSPDATRVAAVRERAGRREVVVLTMPSEAAATNEGSIDLRVLRTDPDAQFNTPRWSPDGRRIVAERRRPGALPELVIVDSGSGEIEQIIAVDNARVVTPTWRPDGRAIVAAADVSGGPFEIYEFPIGGEAVARRLTHSAGATWPDVSADGQTLVFSGYTPDGSDVFIKPYAAIATEGVTFRRETTNSAATTIQEPLKDVRSYSPLATLLPTSWTPLVSTTSDQTRIGAAIAGADLLGRHAYAIGATWLVSSLDPVRPLPSGTPDWSAAYVYSRWRLSPFASAARDTLFRSVVTDEGGSPSTISVERHEFQGGAVLPFTHVRSRTRLFASMVRSDSRYLLQSSDRHVSLTSARGAFTYDSSNVFGYSISPEHGLAAGATIEIARPAFGSDARATTSTADVRAYLPGIGRNHVLAARAAAGLSRGDLLARQAFVVGLASASLSTGDFSADALGLMRDGQTETSGDRLLVSNVEYRLPLATIDRGFGTWPLFLRRVHASFFADAAQVREADGDRWRRAIGTELGVTAVAGYALPFDAVVGIAWGTDDRQHSGATLFARVGRAF
jgi:hypothetical protein